jgi:hypothetical protein
MGGLSYDELFIRSIITWHVNASMPVLLLLQISQTADFTAALSELECKQLSDSFSASMINSNSNTFTERYNGLMGVALKEDEFRSEVVALIKSLDHPFVTFFVASVSEHFISYTTGIGFIDYYARRCAT